MLSRLKCWLEVEAKDGSIMDLKEVFTLVKSNLFYFSKYTKYQFFIMWNFIVDLNHVLYSRKQVREIVKHMLGHRLITKQTHKDGILVQKVMIAESVDIKRETYVCILMDRGYNGPVLIASPAGGMDIETVAEKTPQLIKTVPLDIYYGIDDNIAKEVAEFLGFTEEDIKNKAVYELKNLWKLFVDIDALQIEINPFVETADKQVVAVDAKISFDDNAQYRQKDIFELEDTNEKDPREVEASKYNLNYISMDGNIACLGKLLLFFFYLIIFIVSSLL